MMGCPFAGILVFAITARAGVDEEGELTERGPTVDAGYTEDGVYEVRVYGERDVESARREVIRVMESMEWRHVGVRGDEDVFRGPHAWHGRAFLTQAGLLRFGGQPVAWSVGPLDGWRTRALPPEGTDPYVALQEQPPPQVAVIGRTPSARRIGAVRSRVVQASGPAVLAYRTAVQETAFHRQISELPARLDDLWAAGVPLEGTQPVDTWEGRRAVILEYWASRTDTPEGHEVARTVEAWLSRVVQRSEHPVTWAEQTRANDHAEHGRRLTLVTPDGSASAPSSGCGRP